MTVNVVEPVLLSDFLGSTCACSDETILQFQIEPLTEAGNPNVMSASGAFPDLQLPAEVLPTEQAPALPATPSLEAQAATCTAGSAPASPCGVLAASQEWPDLAPVHYQPPGGSCSPCPWVSQQTYAASLPCPPSQGSWPDGSTLRKLASEPATDTNSFFQEALPPAGPHKRSRPAHHQEESGALDSPALDEWGCPRTVTLTVRQPPVTLMGEQVKALTWEQHAALWKEYVNALSTCLAEADGQAASPAGQRAAELVREAWLLRAYAVAGNSVAARRFHIARLGDSPIANSNRQPTPDMWRRIVRSVRVTPDQRCRLLRLREAFLLRMNRLLEQRQRAGAALIAAVPGACPGVAEYSAAYLQALAAVEELQANLGDDLHLLYWLQRATMTRVLAPLQAADVIVQAYPFWPDTLSILNILASEDLRQTGCTAQSAPAELAQVLLLPPGSSPLGPGALHMEPASRLCSV